MKIIRRHGTSPEERCPSGTAAACPDVLELDDGDFLVIGTSVTPWSAAVAAVGEFGAQVAEDEAVVRVPAAVLIAAAKGIIAEKDKAGTVS